MRKLILFFSGILIAGLSYAQSYPQVTLSQINASTQAALQNCVDTSAYDGDTVNVTAFVVTDGRWTEVGSGSVQGNYRPFVALVDTLNGGAPGPFKGAVIMGAFDNGSNLVPNQTIQSLRPGMLISIDAIVDEFSGLIQLQPVDNNAISIVGAGAAPTYSTINAGDIQDASRNNLLPTGEQWDGSYVELQNVTVTNVSVFSGGSRCEFTVSDANGNQVLVADRFLPMVVNGVQTVNPSSTATTGSFVPPTIGTVYSSIRGIIFQDENGCAGGGGFAGGYEINPWDTTDLNKAPNTPPTIANLSRNPLVPNATQTVTVTADITDLDGSVTSANLFYTADLTAPANLFQSVAMTSAGGAQYSATIPAFPLDSVVRYYVEATDDSANVVTIPNMAPGSAGLNAEFYTVRANGTTIMDVQKVLDVSNGESVLVSDTVTVTGIVTASYQTGDLGYLYLQDPSATEYAGVMIVGGPTSTFGLNRGDEVTVNGIVESQFGFTIIQALNVTSTGSTGTVVPVVLDPSNATLFGSGSDEMERYEGMLVRYENPMPMGRVFVTDANLGFGEYEVGSGQGATVGARVLAGRQDGTRAQSSLDVSYISDTARYAAGLNVAAVQVDTTFNMDALEGMVWYAFGNWKITPRNNNDFIGLVVGIEPIQASKEVETAIFPNPTQNRVNVQIDENYQFDQLRIEVLDMTGRKVVETATTLHLNSINLNGLDKGVYLIRIMDADENLNTSKLILK